MSRSCTVKIFSFAKFPLFIGEFPFNEYELAYDSIGVPNDYVASTLFQPQFLSKMVIHRYSVTLDLCNCI